MNKRPIVFFLMSSGIGGEVITFLRMADWLAKNTERDVYVTDFKNGCVFKYMEQDGIKSVNKLIIPDCLSKNIKRFSQDTKLKLPDNALVFTNAFWAFSKGVIGELLSGNNVNFLFYFVDPNTVSDVSNRFSWLKRMIFLWKVRKIFRFCQ